MEECWTICIVPSIQNIPVYVFRNVFRRPLHACLFQKQRIQLEDIRFAVEAFSACVSRVGADMDMPKYIINEQVRIGSTYP